VNVAEAKASVRKNDQGAATASSERVKSATTEGGDFFCIARWHGASFLGGWIFCALDWPDICDLRGAFFGARKIPPLFDSRVHKVMMGMKLMLFQER
jgi:hypothetical protein